MTSANNSDDNARALTTLCSECHHPLREHSFEQDEALSWYGTGAEVPTVWWICPFDESEIPRD
jgi:hypothetical protein